MSHASSFAVPDAAQIAADVERALTEDLGRGDATAGLLPARARAHAALTCRDAAVIAGTARFDACFRRLDPAVHLDWQVSSLICVFGCSTFPDPQPDKASRRIIE